MHQGVKWMLVAAGGVVLLATAVYGASAWRGATPAQRAALEDMDRPVELPGRNAFAAMMLLRYPLGADELAALEQPETWRAVTANRVDGRRTLRNDFERQLLGDVEAFEPDLGTAPCNSDEPCLATVEADSRLAGAWLRAHRDWIDRVDRLSGYGHYRTLRPDVLAWPPALGGMSVALKADRAARFVGGEREPALAQVCRDIGAWRRLSAHSESLLVSSSARNVVEGQLELFAEMLGRWPADAALPAACTTALAAPSPTEQSVCNALRGEFREGRAARRGLGEHPDDGLANLFYRHDMTDALAAESMQRACTRGAEGPGRKPLIPLRLECVRNAAGCILFDIAEPGYAIYRERAEAFGDHVRLAATLAWLHGTDATDGRSLVQRLDDRPATLRGSSPVTIAAGGTALEVEGSQASRKAYRLPVAERLRD